MPSLMQISDKQLKDDLGIKLVGVRKTILHHLAEYKKNASVEQEQQQVTIIAKQEKPICAPTLVLEMQKFAQKLRHLFKQSLSVSQQMAVTYQKLPEFVTHMQLLDRSETYFKSLGTRCGLRIAVMGKK